MTTQDYEAQKQADVGGPVRYAALWRRFVASVVDIAIMVVLVLALLWVRTLVLQLLVGSSDSVNILLDVMIRSIAVGTDLANLGVLLLYFPYLESSALQATLGKYLLGIVVTRTNGTQLSCLRAFGRYVLKISSNVVPIGWLLALFSAKRQTFHDQVAGTLVLERRQA